MASSTRRRRPSQHLGWKHGTSKLASKHGTPTVTTPSGLEHPGNRAAASTRGASDTRVRRQLRRGLPRAECCYGPTATRNRRREAPRCRGCPDLATTTPRWRLSTLQSTAALADHAQIQNGRTESLRHADADAKGVLCACSGHGRARPTDVLTTTVTHGPAESPPAAAENS